MIGWLLLGAFALFYSAAITVYGPRGRPTEQLALLFWLLTCYGVLVLVAVKVSS